VQGPILRPLMSLTANMIYHQDEMLDVASRLASDAAMIQQAQPVAATEELTSWAEADAERDECCPDIQHNPVGPDYQIAVE